MYLFIIKIKKRPSFRTEVQSMDILTTNQLVLIISQHGLIYLIKLFCLGTLSVCVLAATRLEKVLISK